MANLYGNLSATMGFPEFQPPRGSYSVDFGLSAGYKALKWLVDSQLKAQILYHDYFQGAMAGAVLNPNPDQAGNGGIVVHESNAEQGYTADFRALLQNLGAVHAKNIGHSYETISMGAKRYLSAAFSLADYLPEQPAAKNAKTIIAFEKWIINLAQSFGISPGILKQAFVGTLLAARSSITVAAKITNSRLYEAGRKATPDALAMAIHQNFGTAPSDWPRNSILYNMDGPRGRSFSKSSRKSSKKRRRRDSY